MGDRAPIRLSTRLAEGRSWKVPPESYVLRSCRGGLHLSSLLKPLLLHMVISELLNDHVAAPPAR